MLSSGGRILIIGNLMMMKMDHIVLSSSRQLPVSTINSALAVMDVQNNIETSRILRWKGLFFRVTRDALQDYYGDDQGIITLTLFTTNTQSMAKLIQEAREEYQTSTSDVVNTFNAVNRGAAWRKLQSRQKRSLASIILEERVKLELLRDATEFLNSKEWSDTYFFVPSPYAQIPAKQVSMPRHSTSSRLPTAWQARCRQELNHICACQ